tara:strand:+ start:260 stop:622 length:363 start_codon:yes stop_codon:yes gene_type:complete
MVKFNIDYDGESDDLFLYSDTKSKGSIEIGDVILDFDHKGDLVGIELLQATKFLKDSIVKEDSSLVSKSFLSSLEACTVETKQQANFLFIKIQLSGKKESIVCPINAPLIKEKSPALVYA